ncbi:alpha/beta hydrolase [Caulobacter segnis]|uniref:alpha/beta fold hydrolase n=1 Tax=Caulobacter segnis TaxID=88688 RepID=UPI00240FDC65|nr:alpha/beta hydrolase [Caulobacter segnis]MDG2523304.1 alpha/beta hydrolase [Caulobacter segnis]
MPHVIHRGQRIHYTVEGDGPLVVLQHGLFMTSEDWREPGFIDALTAAGFRVACIDSLGHGLSDKPHDPALYVQEQRAGDIVAVIDDLGEQRAHLIGYSMGAWMSVGVAKHHPGRLASLTVGGWDLVGGVPRMPGGKLTFDMFMAFARSVAPALTAWVTPELEPGVRACFDNLADLDGAADAVLNGGFPVLLWDGQGDPYHAPSQAFAAANGLPFLSTPGDHIGAVTQPTPEVLAGIAGFLKSAD